MDTLWEKCERALQEGYLARKENIPKSENPYSMIADWRLHDHWEMGWNNRNMLWMTRRKQENDNAYKDRASQAQGDTRRRRRVS